ncbi:MAG: YdiY family protein [Pseudorhodobacter sp.]
MNGLFLKGTISALALGAMTTGVLAQDTLTGSRAVSDRLDDVQRDVQRDMDRANDAARFGNPEFRPGLSGSASLSYSGKSGNNKSQDLSFGARLRHSQGPLVQTLGAVVDYQESNNSSTKEDVFAIYDANYYFNDSFYGFVLGRIQTDGLANTAGDVKRDAFLGFGPGYRVINRPDMTWRVQAGIGVSYLKDGVGMSTTETGYIASSRFFYQFNENVFLTNDTDVLKSKTALRVNNDFGVNFKMTDAFSTRVSYLTEYNDSRAIRTDNKLGVSLVYGF